MGEPIWDEPQGRTAFHGQQAKGELLVDEKVHLGRAAIVGNVKLDDPYGPAIPPVGKLRAYPEFPDIRLGESHGLDAIVRDRADGASSVRQNRNLPIHQG